MTRVIKLRAWFPSAKRMLHFEEIVIDDEYDRLALNLVADNATREYKHRAGKSYIPNESFTLMQFTGLLGKQGKEIYEGDIVKGKYYTEPFEVQWDADGGLEDGSMNPEIWMVGFRFPADGELEVIGNIWEGLYR